MALRQNMKKIILTALKHCATVASGLGNHKKLFILIYHRVLNQPDYMRPGEIDINAFSWQMQLLAIYFNVLPLDQALAGLQNGSLPPRAVVITFDDGYADNLHNAIPILKQHGLTATFFISSGYLNGGRMWNDSIIEAIRIMPQPALDLTEIGLGVYAIETEAQKANTASMILKKLKYLDPAQCLAYTQFISEQVISLPDDLMLTSTELQTLQRHGMEIGGHTVSHPILAKLDDNEAMAEISANKTFLEQLLNTPINYFAYPNGKLAQDYLPRQTELVKNSRYHAALTTNLGVSNHTSSIWELPRFTPWDATPVKFMFRLVYMYLKSKPRPKQRD